MKLLKRTLCILLTVIAVATTTVSCSKKPYGELDLTQYIRIGEYGDITVTEAELQGKLDEYISAFLQTNSTKTQIKEGYLTAGDIAVIDYTCQFPDAAPDGEKLLSDSGCQVLIGSGKYFKEIEDALTALPIGAKAPQLYISVPEDFGLSALAGKTVVYNITLKEAYRLSEPQYDDALVSAKTRYGTVEEHRAALKEQALYELVWEKLLECTEVISYPYQEVNERTLDFIEHYTNLANASSLTLEEYVAKKFFIDLTALHLKADEYAKSLVKEEMAVYSISRIYDISLGDDEYRQAAQRYADERGCSSVSELEQRYGSSVVSYTLLKDKVMRYVTDHSLAVSVLAPATDAELEATPET